MYHEWPLGKRGEMRSPFTGRTRVKLVRQDDRDVWLKVTTTRSRYYKHGEIVKVGKGRWYPDAEAKNA